MEWATLKDLCIRQYDFNVDNITTQGKGRNLVAFYQDPEDPAVPTEVCISPLGEWDNFTHVMITGTRRDFSRVYDLEKEEKSILELLYFLWSFLGE